MVQGAGSRQATVESEGTQKRRQPTFQSEELDGRGGTHADEKSAEILRDLVVPSILVAARAQPTSNKRQGVATTQKDTLKYPAVYSSK